VSEIGFGAWGIGGRTGNLTSYGDTDNEVSKAALRRALDLGITLFDTAPAYGLSEELIGETLGSVRHRIVIATKTGVAAWGQPEDFSTDGIVGLAERSLRRMGTDYIDILQLHNASVGVLASDTVQGALARLTAQGKIRQWGASLKSPEEAVEALRRCDIPVVQCNFNMMDVRAATSGLFAEIARHASALIARTPLCFGFLSGRIDRTTAFPPDDHRLAWPPAQRLRWIEGAPAVLGTVPPQPPSTAVQSALRFCLSFPAVSTVIPGILTPQEAEENAAASDLGPLPESTVARVLELNRERDFFPSPPRRS
jgi:aryl-alcohol dehydrogenase-like predicted oxidoreductase